jgi:hypothetical protein
VAIVLALPRLFDAVVARFAAEGTAVANLFGWRASAQQLTGAPRIVWIPGDPRGSLGQILPPRNPGRIDPGRPLATLDELFTIEIVAADTAMPETERAQYQVVRELYDAWYRAVHLAAHGAFRVLSSEWIGPAKERRHGAGIRALCAVQAMIPDAVPTLAEADTTLTVSLSELDVDEDVDIAPEDP